MFGCFTRNIYVSKICLHFVCAFEIPKDSFEKGKKSRESRSLMRQDAPPFCETVPQNSGEVWATAVLMPL